MRKFEQSNKIKNYFKRAHSCRIKIICIRFRILKLRTLVVLKLLKLFREDARARAQTASQSGGAIELDGRVEIISAIAPAIFWPDQDGCRGSGPAN